MFLFCALRVKNDRCFNCRNTMRWVVDFSGTVAEEWQAAVGEVFSK